MKGTKNGHCTPSYEMIDFRYKENYTTLGQNISD